VSAFFGQLIVFGYSVKTMSKLVLTLSVWYQVFVLKEQSGHQAIFKSSPCLCQFRKRTCNWSPNKGIPFVKSAI